MRVKRSKDTRLVDKFSKQRDNLAAESRLHQPVNPPTTTTTITTNDDFSHNTDEEEDDIKARNCHASVLL